MQRQNCNSQRKEDITTKGKIMNKKMADLDDAVNAAKSLAATLLASGISHKDIGAAFIVGGFGHFEKAHGKKKASEEIAVFYSQHFKDVFAK